MKLNPKVFERAAAYIFYHPKTLSSTIISWLEGVILGKHHGLFRELYFDGGHELRFQRGYRAHIILESRILALLLAAEWVRDLNRKPKRKKRRP